jgi:hypothetical protein
LSAPKFVTFSVWRAGTTSWYSTGESPPIKAAAVGSAEPNSEEILLRLRQHFVDARILSTPIISDEGNISVSANILSAPMFCRCKYFVGANIFACV